MKKSRLKQWLHRLPLAVPLLNAKIGAEQIAGDIAELKSLILSEIEEQRRREAIRTAGPRSLHAFEHRVHSQNGEDGVVQEIFARIGAPTKTFIEIGVGDGWENNTLFLLPLGWRGVWVDADPALGATIAEWPAETQATLKFAIATVTAENVTKVLEELGAPREPDLLSIDVDQNTYHVWATMQDWRPRLIVVEYNANLPPTVDWKVDYDPTRGWDGSINFGASLKALERLGRRFGYQLVHCELCGVNAFFVRDDLVAEHFDEPATAEYHFEPPRKTRPFEPPGSRRVLLDRGATHL